MFKLWRLRNYLRQLDNPCLWLSGGSDSTLLLHVLLANAKLFSILRFDEGWTREQRAIVDALTIKHNLRIYAYPAAWGTMVGNESGDLSLISGYAVGSNGETAALFRDVVPGSRCSFDVSLDLAESVTPPVKFDIHILGTKKGESHWAMNGKPFLDTRRWEVGDVDFVAPLYNWTNAQVIAALREFGVSWKKPSDNEDTGNIANCCSLCLRPSESGEVFCPKEQKPIPVVDWNPAENLESWQQAAGV